MIAKWRSKTAIAFDGDIGQVVMGDLHQKLQLHKQLSVALIAMTTICGWSLYQIPSAGAASSTIPNYCYLDGKHYSVGSATRMASGEILECVRANSKATSYWHEIEWQRLH